MQNNSQAAAPWPPASMLSSYWRPLALIGVAAILANLLLLRSCVHPIDFGSTSDIPSAWNATSTRRSPPRVACFFMVDQKSVETAMSVRYSHWGRRCAHFVIFSNGVASGGEERIDGNTVLADIHRVIQSEFEARNVEATFMALNASLRRVESYTIFPSPEDETKEYLSLKSFYCWMYMTRQYTERVDYIMKVDPDTFMLMDNYFSYLSRYHTPEQHAYIGRVFKTNGNHRTPFVTGLSCTLSKTTARLLLSKSSIQRSDTNPECSAESFDGRGAADDYVLSECLSSFGVYPAFTRDERGRERFMHFSPSEHVYGKDEAPAWYDENSFTPHRPRNKCCSDEACAFHYVEPTRQNDTLVQDEVFGVWHWKDSSG